MQAQHTAQHNYQQTTKTTARPPDNGLVGEGVGLLSDRRIVRSRSIFAMFQPPRSGEDAAERALFL